MGMQRQVVATFLVWLAGMLDDPVVSVAGERVDLSSREERRWLLERWP